MLPFLKNKQEGSVSTSPDAVKRASDGDEGQDFLETILAELFEAKTNKARANAFRAAIQLLEQEPNEEIENGQLSDS